jgi:hypothetical protein
MKKVLLSLFLAFSLSACATNPDAALQGAINGQTADVLSTGVGLAKGFSEANPLGAGLLIAKPLAISLANQYPEPERKTALAWYEALGYAPATYNTCLILFEPSSIAGCVIAGALVGWWTYDNAMKRE